MSDHIVDEEFDVLDAEVKTVRFNIQSPSLRPNGLYACTFEVSSGRFHEELSFYGANRLHALLLAINGIADQIDRLLKQTGGRIESALWADLRRHRTSQEELDAARAAYFAGGSSD
jgi:hypothetical protein